jgi:hypothetical protein
MQIFTPSKTPCTARTTARTLSLVMPSNLPAVSAFSRVNIDDKEHQRMLGEVQRFRGRIALQENAISPWQLSSDGRHVQPADECGIHLVGSDHNGQIVSCMRYLPHRNTTHWTDLRVFHTPLAAHSSWRPILEEALVEELERARQLNYDYVEMGGWVVAPELRNSIGSARMVATAYALARFLGGALGITTATTKHRSSSILRRLGGSSLCARGIEVPPYYDPQYQCEMEILRFDSSSPGRRCAEVIQDCQLELTQVPVIAAEPRDPNMYSLANLQEVRASA